MQEISNNKLTLLRKLNQKKYRQQEQLFLVEGARAVNQIIENKLVQIIKLFFDESQRYWQQKQWKPFIADIESSFIEEDKFAEISDTDNPQGVIAMCAMPEEMEPEVMADGHGVIVATDAIQDPGNLGTIIRTTGWFGVQGLLSGNGTVDLFHPKVVRSTAGATGSVPHMNVSIDEVLPVFEAKGWQIVLLDAGKDAVPLQEVNSKEKMIIIIGNEGNGISPSLFTNKRIKARIASPRGPKNVESLNAAIATSIALYELC